MHIDYHFYFFSNKKRTFHKIVHFASTILFLGNLVRTSQKVNYPDTTPAQARLTT